EQPTPCGSTHPSFSLLLEPEATAQGLGVPLNGAPASVGRGHRLKADSAGFPVLDDPFSEPGSNGGGRLRRDKHPSSQSAHASNSNAGGVSALTAGLLL